MKYITFIVYILIWDVGLIIGTSYFVFIEGESGWWFVLAVLLTSVSFKPRHFNITELPRQK